MSTMTKAQAVARITELEKEVKKMEGLYFGSLNVISFLSNPKDFVFPPRMSMNETISEIQRVLENGTADDKPISAYTTGKWIAGLTQHSVSGVTANNIVWRWEKGKRIQLQIHPVAYKQDRQRSRRIIEAIMSCIKGWLEEREERSYRVSLNQGWVTLSKVDAEQEKKAQKEQEEMPL